MVWQIWYPKRHGKFTFGSGNRWEIRVHCLGTKRYSMQDSHNYLFFIGHWDKEMAPIASIAGTKVLDLIRKSMNVELTFLSNLGITLFNSLFQIRFIIKLIPVSSVLTNEPLSCTCICVFTTFAANLSCVESCWSFYIEKTSVVITFPGKSDSL